MTMGLKESGMGAVIAEEELEARINSDVDDPLLREQEFILVLGIERIDVDTFEEEEVRSSLNHSMGPGGDGSSTIFFYPPVGPGGDGAFLVPTTQYVSETPNTMDELIPSAETESDNMTLFCASPDMTESVQSELLCMLNSSTDLSQSEGDKGTVERSRKSKKKLRKLYWDCYYNTVNISANMGKALHKYGEQSSQTNSANDGIKEKKKKTLQQHWEEFSLNNAHGDEINGTEASVQKRRRGEDLGNREAELCSNSQATPVCRKEDITNEIGAEKKRRACHKLKRAPVAGTKCDFGTQETDIMKSDTSSKKEKRSYERRRNLETRCNGSGRKRSLGRGDGQSVMKRLRPNVAPRRPNQELATSKSVAQSPQSTMAEGALSSSQVSCKNSDIAKRFLELINEIRSLMMGKSENKEMTCNLCVSHMNKKRLSSTSPERNELCPTKKRCVYSLKMAYVTPMKSTS